MTETRIHVEPSRMGKVVGWGSLIFAGVALTGGIIAYAVVLQADIRHNSEELADIKAALDRETGSAETRSEELDEGIKELRGDFGDLHRYVADQLGHHRGEHGRIESAADTLEGILRRLPADD